MNDLNSIIKELKKLKVPYEAYRNNEVIWCPIGYDPVQKKYDKLMFMEAISPCENKIAIGFYSRDNEWRDVIKEEEIPYHNALCKMIDFYYNEIE